MTNPEPAEASHALAILDPSAGDELEPKDLASLAATLVDENDPFLRAAVRLAAMMDALGVGNDSAQARRTRARLGAAAAMMSLSGRHRMPGKPITEDEKATFLTALAAGLGMAKACGLVPTVNPSSWYFLRSHDEEFSGRWDDALDFSADGVLTRFADIATFGDESSMATIKAGDIVVRNRSRRSRDDLRVEAARAQRGRHSVTLHIEMNTPSPD